MHSMKRRRVEKVHCTQHDLRSIADDVLLRIFQLALHWSRFFFHYRRVCKKWYRCSLLRQATRFWGFHHRFLDDGVCFGLSRICSGIRSITSYSWGKITETGVRALASLSNLSKFEIYGHGYSYPSVTSDSLQALSVLEQLEILSLSSFSLAQDQALNLDFVAGLRSLRELRLSHSRISDASLACLEGKNHLRVLRISFCSGNITTHGLRVLRSLTELREFHISDIDFSDVDSVAVVRMLVGLRSLRKVMLGQLRVNDTSVQALSAALPEMTELHLESENAGNDAARFNFVATFALPCLDYLSVSLHFCPPPRCTVSR